MLLRWTWLSLMGSTLHCSVRIYRHGPCGERRHPIGSTLKESTQLKKITKNMIHFMLSLLTQWCSFSHVLYYLASFFTLKNLLMGKFLSWPGLIRSRTLSFKRHMPFYVSSCSVHKTTILLDLLQKSDILCNDDGSRTPIPESWYTRLVHTPFISSQVKISCISTDTDFHLSRCWGGHLDVSEM